VLTWSTYDILLVALSMKERIDEAELVYNKIIKDYARSTPRKIYSRMISMYDCHGLPHKILEVYPFLSSSNFAVSMKIFTGEPRSRIRSPIE
jgi:pentatricopeptide repeat protein